MWTDKVRVLDDVAPADWLAARLKGGSGAEPWIVPTGFAAYARVLHPVEFRNGRSPVTWAHVAEVVGGRIEAHTRWHVLIGSDAPYRRTSELWPDGYPQWGNLDLRSLQGLCDALAAHTSTPRDCFFAMWEGWGQLAGGLARTRLTTGGGTPAEPLLTDAERGAPRLRLPGRDYFLLRGPLAAMGELVHHDGSQTWWTQSPSLFWPADRTWCVATEIDADSTLVGGSTEAIDAVLAASVLEAMRV